MTFDWNRTVSLTKGGLLDAENTWRAYLAENPPWQQTAMLLTGPLLLANVLLSLVFSRLLGGFMAYGYQGGWLSVLVLALVAAGLGIFFTTYVFNTLAGVFQGTPDFSRAFAAVSLAAIPAWLAGVLAALLPYVGFVLALAGGILSLVYLYRIMPMALNVPPDKRIPHFVLSLLLIIVLNAVLGAIL